ncbi:hypothetical protein EUGRSUZ_C01801 [Eucalyptus grandis]|uniref:Uncharacterized protein n=2 Tax=Eucalyptus grandis TaxID=71139 RepID=A0ACC3LDM0_EUCGR|nr:hypothetical protein EUGRSUZ_C01801 [Eucalyptus grandis]
MPRTKAESGSCAARTVTLRRATANGEACELALKRESRQRERERAREQSTKMVVEVEKQTRRATSPRLRLKRVLSPYVRRGAWGV